MPGGQSYGRISPREALVAVRALVVLLPRVNPVVSVELVGAGEPPGAVGPRADVGLVADVRAEVRAQVRRLLVLARALRVVALVQGAPVRVAVRVLAADATALLALSLRPCGFEGVGKLEFVVDHDFMIGLSILGRVDFDLDVQTISISFA